MTLSTGFYEITVSNLTEFRSTEISNITRSRLWTNCENASKRFNPSCENIKEWRKRTHDVKKYKDLRSDGGQEMDLSDIYESLKFFAEETGASHSLESIWLKKGLKKLCFLGYSEFNS